MTCLHSFALVSVLKHVWVYFIRILSLCRCKKHFEQVRAVVVENAFLSVSHMVDKLLPMLTGIKWLVLRLDWNNEAKAKRLIRPVLYISGRRRRRIYEAKSAPSRTNAVADSWMDSWRCWQTV